VRGDQGGGGLLVVDREGDDPDAVVRQSPAGPFEGAQLPVAVGAPGAPVEQNDGEVTGDASGMAIDCPSVVLIVSRGNGSPGLRRVNGVGSVVVDMRRTLTPSW